MSTLYERARPPRSQATLRVEQLLSRYPELSEAELTELISLFPHLNMVSRAMLAADEDLAEKLDQFYRTHGRRMDLVVAPRTALLTAAALALLVILWLVLG